MILVTVTSAVLVGCQTLAHTSLARLYFDYNRNGLTSWEDVDTLGRFFPNLKQLCMLENPVEEISIEGERGVADTFPHLEVINISDTTVASWRELEKFRQFPKLCAIRLKGIPLLEVSRSLPA